MVPGHDHRMTALLDRIIAFRGASVVVLGDLMLDRYVHGDVRRISPEAPVPVFAIEREEERLGGAANVACNIASLGGTATLIGVVGRDAAGQALGRLAADRAGLTARLIADPARVTSLKTRFVAAGQQLFRADAEETQAIGAGSVEAVLAALAEMLPAARALVCSDYSKGVLTTEVLARAIALARRLGTPVIVDPKARDLARYAGASVITPNAREASAATGIECDSDEGVAEAARRISATIGGGIVIVTRGGRGMSVFEPDQGGGRIAHLPTRSREVHDVTGAGDTVVATLALGLATGAPLDVAVALANAAAGLAVGLHGTVAVEAARLISALHAAPVEADGGKVVSVATAAGVAEAWRREGLGVVFTNGCFDLLHRGHLGLLRFARQQGDRLIVAINADASVRRLKGPERPVQGEAERASLIAAIGLVDLVVVFADDTPLEVITAIRPDVIVKGADYAEHEVVGGDFVKSLGGRVALAPIEAGASTTGLLRRARGSETPGVAKE